MLSPWLHRSRVAFALTGLLALAACSSAGDPATSSTTPVTGSASQTTTPAVPATFPVTIDNAFGSTTIPEEPTRVVTWGWASADAAIALGVVPVAIPHQAYGGNAAGVLPWIADALTEMGAPTPEILPDTTEVPFEAIAAAEPDVILAPYSGITEAEYTKLSAIAPTVAYPGQAWSTPWRDVVTITGRALGREKKAGELLAENDALIAAAAQAHPELSGKTVAAVWDTADAFYVYEAADPRVEFLTDLGMVVAPSVPANSTGESTFYYTISTELVDEITSDVLVAYSTDQAEAEQFLATPYVKKMQQAKAGRVAAIVGTDLIASVSPPTILSLPWGLDATVEALSAAASG